jgi:hypothetical protein
MREADVIAELGKDPFQPVRLHMVSGKVLDVLSPNAAHPLRRCLMILKNPSLGSPTRAEGYDVISYDNIERLEQLQFGKPSKKRKSA